MRRRHLRCSISSYSTANCTTNDHTDPDNSPHRVRHHQPDSPGPHQYAGLDFNDLIISDGVGHDDQPAVVAVANEVTALASSRTVGHHGRQPGRQLGGRCNLHVSPPEKGVSVTSEKRDVKHQRRQEVSMWRIDVRTVAVFR